MKQNRLLNMGALIVVLALSGLMTGCMEKDVYDPNREKDPLPGPGEYFDFEMRGDVKLSVNYDVTGFTTLIEVYDVDPMEVVEGTPVKKAGVEAIFKIYTDENGKYEGKMNIPTSVNSVYLYTETWGLPRCVKLEVKDGTVNLDLSRRAPDKAAEKATTRAYQFTGSAPYTIDKAQNLYSLCQWGKMGNLELDNYGELTLNPGYITRVKSVEAEYMGDFVKRMMGFFNPAGMPNVDNSRLVRETKTTNLNVTKEGTTLDVVFVNRDAANNNTFGYYYYKTGEKVDLYSVKKYIIFPNVAIAPEHMSQWGINILRCGDKARLIYYDGQGKASEKFPAGYTVGWFIYANGYIYNESSLQIPHQDEIKTDDAAFISSNRKRGDEGQIGGFVAVNDKTSGKVIIGVEDGANSSYCDLLFYVDASPEGSIDDSDRPGTPDDGKDDPVKPEDAVETISGTLAFEDIWPSGGDYDMNDVVIEYSRETYFNKNNLVAKIVDTFKPVHDGATFINAFAYQLDAGYVGKLTLPAGAIYEEETSSIIVFPNAKTAQGQSFQIVREFVKESINKENLLFHPYNPYIIVKYVAGEKNRTEVHLPKHKATSMADQNKIGSQKDAYYIDREGAYPFAIDIPMLNFATVTETRPIDSEYPGFKKWADSMGSEEFDWYKKHEGAK